jgi:mannose-1-phosphate guanylyltransferase
MKALILAAGEGTRLRPLTLTCPKPMLPVGDAPLLVHIIRWLRGQGIRDVAINLHYLPEVITAYLGDGSRFGVQITYSYEDPILGSAGAAKKLEGFLSSPFLVVYGDMLLDVDLEPLVKLHRSSGSAVTIGLMEVDDPSSKGVVQLDERGRVLRFVEKPRPGEIQGRLVSAGIYLVEASVMEQIPANSYYDFGHDLIPRLLSEGVPLFARLLDGYLLDIGTPESYQKSQEDVSRLGRYWGLLETTDG